jgi:hypothetical protein
MVIILIFRFLGHDGAYESNHFLEQKKRMMMTTTVTSTNNKSEKAKGGWVLCNFFRVLFCGTAFFFPLRFY